MGNEQAMPERHVSFESRAMNPGDRSYDPRYSYDLAPNMRSREFNMGQRGFQERSQIRTNYPNEQWNYQPGGGSTRTVTRQEWQGGGRQPPDYGGYEEYDWSSTRGQRPYPYTQRTTYVSNSRGGRPGEDSWHQQPTSYYSHTTPRQSTTVTRSYETDSNYPGGGGDLRGNRAFNTRDYDDPWYHYKPVVNRRPDWALVGRHVLARPASARQVKTVEQDFRRMRDFDTFSDPASYGGPAGGVRQTFNPRFPRAQQAIYNYQDQWADEVETGIRRPTQSSYYKTYSVNSYR